MTPSLGCMRVHKGIQEASPPKIKPRPAPPPLLASCLPLALSSPVTPDCPSPSPFGKCRTEHHFLVAWPITDWAPLDYFGFGILLGKWTDQQDCSVHLIPPHPPKSMQGCQWKQALFKGSGSQAWKVPEEELPGSVSGLVWCSYCPDENIGVQRRNMDLPKARWLSRCGS